MSGTERTYLSNERQHQLMLFFNYYRLALAILLLVLLQFGLLIPDTAPSGTDQTLTIATGLYLVLCGLGMTATHREEMNQTTILAIMITDLMLLTLITNATGGVEGGFGNLMLVSVSTGALFLSLKNSLFLAAIASSGIVYTELFAGYSSSSNSFLRAALLGIAFFAVTILIQYILQRVRLSEKIAEQHAENIIDLQFINEMVIQRMRTGIIVCSQNGQIRMINQSAHLLVSNEAESEILTRVPKVLQEKINLWIDGRLNNLLTLRFNPKLPDVQISIAVLQDSPNSDLLIFLEDTSHTKQQAQQMKLASLGRLTASIAHEIRNPLGAISHAAQLLGESPSKDNTDLRMIEIIENHTLRMNNIIENVLQLSRQSKSVPELFTLTDWLTHFHIEFHDSNLDSTIELNCPKNIQVRFDQSQLHQVITNLVTNGLRYSKSFTGESRVSIKAGILNVNDQPFLDIIDFGAGLSIEQQEHIFEPFFTTENTGTGLGLFICKELCEANQSRLEWIAPKSETETGCRFRILFAHPQREQLD